jgi:ATP-dependent DNA helicase RecQ
VIHQTARARGTIIDYLCDFIHREKPEKIDVWITPDAYERIAAAVKQHGGERLKPLFIALDEKVPYEDIRVVVAHLARNQSTS